MSNTETRFNKETKSNFEKPLSVSVTTVMNADRAEAWAKLSEFDDVYKWAPGVSKSHALKGKEAVGVGHGRHCEVEGFGGIDEYITAWQEHQGLEYSISPVGPLHKARSRWTLSDSGNGKTRLDIVLSYQVRFGLIGKLMHKFIIKGKLQGSLQSTALAFNKRVEASAMSRKESPIAMAS